MITKHFCVIGSPVSHSKSPEIVGALFSKASFSADYIRKEIKDEAALFSFIEEVKEGRYSGFNVTMPWKTALFSISDELTDEAKLTSSVNTVAVIRSKDSYHLVGHSTDGAGMLSAIQKTTQLKISDLRFIILGCGGCARSVIAAALLSGAAHISVSCREGANKDLLMELLDEYKNKYFSESLCCPVSEVTLFDPSDSDLLARELATADSTPTVLVNCTPLGMKPQENVLPVPSDTVFPSSLIVADAVYNPEQTLLLKKAVSSGCTVVFGTQMLQCQAEEGVSFWLDKKDNLA